jgi:ubiquinone/menaquinone biosynthesis C-methylase UbiE
VTIQIESSTGVSEFSYLELLAYLGMTRHLGGWGATRELAATCEVRPGKNVLDVGCGVGRTPVIFAKQYGCRVTGIDLSARMVAWARQRVRGERAGERVEIRQADAQDLPFEDETFDAVFTESVMVFVPDRKKAMREFLRVTKPGGFIGLNETCWLKAQVPEELKARLSGDYFSGAQLEFAGTWKDLLQAAGLKGVTASIHEITARSDLRDRMKWFGLKGVLVNLYRIVSLSSTNPEARKAIRKIVAMQRDTPPDLYRYYGYGIFAGRK